MTTLAVLRPEQWEWPLFLHLVGATLLVGGLAAVTATTAAALRHTADRAVLLERVALRTLLLAVWPGLVVTFAGGVWAEGREDVDAFWVGVGHTVTEGGALVVLAITLLTWRSARRTGAGDARPLSGRLAAVLTPLYLAVLIFAIWAMTTKPD